jgi:hypothetical protein
MEWPVDKASRNGRRLAGLLTSTICAVGFNGIAVSVWVGDATMTSVKSVGSGDVPAKTGRWRRTCKLSKQLQFVTNILMHIIQCSSNTLGTASER